MRVFNYAKAVAEWVAAGRPTRSDEDVATIFRVICKPCALHYRGSCRECGCRVRAEGPAVFNKIKMATQHCPRNKW
jgi:hypothetical protein